MRQAWSTPPLTEEGLEEWYVYVAIYEDVGMQSPAGWINQWLKTRGLQSYPCIVIRAVNAYIVRHQAPRQLYHHKED